MKISEIVSAAALLVTPCNFIRGADLGEYDMIQSNSGLIRGRAMAVDRTLAEVNLDTWIIRNKTKVLNGTESLGFLWKLWYSDNIKWDDRGDDWCVRCQGEAGCILGSLLITNYCNPNDKNQRWEYVGGGENGTGQIMAKNAPENLCVTRVLARQYKLQPCVQGAKRQLFSGFDLNDKFALQPLKKEGRFLTMHHHPKHLGEFNGDVIYDQPRYKAEKTQTLFWIADFRDRVEERLVNREHTCSKDDKCVECEGQCKEDDDCMGELKCWKRSTKYWRSRVELGEATPYANVPGCIGMGEFGGDYCYDPTKA